MGCVSSFLRDEEGGCADRRVQNSRISLSKSGSLIGRMPGRLNTWQYSGRMVEGWKRQGRMEREDCKQRRTMEKRRRSCQRSKMKRERASRRRWRRRNISSTLKHNQMHLMSNRLVQLLENRAQVDRQEGSLVSTTKKTADCTEEAWNKNIKLQEGVDKAAKYCVLHMADTRQCA